MMGSIERAEGIESALRLAWDDSGGRLKRVKVGVRNVASGV
jgi:hypothetical protein